MSASTCRRRSRRGRGWRCRGRRTEHNAPSRRRGLYTLIRDLDLRANRVVATSRAVSRVETRAGPGGGRRHRALDRRSGNSLSLRRGRDLVGRGGGDRQAARHPARLARLDHDRPGRIRHATCRNDQRRSHACCGRPELGALSTNSQWNAATDGVGDSHGAVGTKTLVPSPPSAEEVLRHLRDRD